MPSPGVADALVRVHDEERSIPLGEMVPDGESRLTAPDDDRLEPFGCGGHHAAPAALRLPMTTPIVSRSPSVGLNSTISAPA
jgi:hypothetical protein